MGYDYQVIAIEKEMQSIYLDRFGSFGWIVENINEIEEDVVCIKFKRNQKIKNKIELTRLQKQLEACIEEIHMLEQSINSDAAICAYVVGAMGTGTMAGSLFSLEAGNFLLCVSLVVLGFIEWILPYFIYRNIKNKRTKKVTPLIERKYDELSDVCEKAKALLDE